MKDIESEISRCIIKLLMKEPFYAHFLSGIIRVITDEIPTAAVGFKSGKIALYVNENFFLKELKSFNERVAVIKHETLHILFKHLFRMQSKSYDNKLFNIAADLVVNQLIEPWRLPESAITLSTFSALNLPPDKSVEWYYKKLKQQSSDDNTKKTISQVSEEISHSDHSKWGENKGASSNIIETELDRMIIQAKDRTPLKDYGSIPLGIKKMINVIIEKRKPQIDWKRALRLFSTSSRKTRVYYTMKRISKRYGTRPGIKIKRYQRLAVAIDTSGSIKEDDFVIFFSEIHSIWKQGAEIEVIECDAEVQRKYSYRGKLPKFISGGGGTLFDPVFSYLKSNRFEKYDGCIYLTDGYAPEAKIKPPCSLFWCITKDGKLGNHLKYGRAVKMN
ncbi:MAG: hypothetical protein CMC57_00020 [Flavobacteriaceae bacterium]|nr:hypothetical protein [Flavobacteriaceae bacterium]